MPIHNSMPGAMPCGAPESPACSMPSFAPLGMTRNASHPRAFTLIEMVATLLLFGTFMLVATRLFVEAHNLNRRALETESAIARLDNALHRLRQDVWNATGLKTPSDQQLLITQHPDITITWTVTSAGDLTRTSPPVPNQSWSNLPPIRLSVRNRALLLAITENNQTQTQTFTSQITPPEAPHE